MKRWQSGCVLFIILAVSSLAWARLPPRPPLGNARARVKVLIFEDLECPSCAQWHQYLESVVLPRYGSRVAFYLRDYPLPQHEWAFNAAVIERYFSSLNPKLYFAWVNFCYRHQNQITPDNLMRYAARIAAGFGVSGAQINQAFANPEFFAAVQADQQAGNRLHVHHTPTIFVMFHGREEVDSFGQLTSALNQALGQ
jgi:protein-disulfide isomerase